MASMREIKSRLSSVRSSQKITGARRMIASARLKQTELSLRNALPYEKALQAMLNHLNTYDFDVNSTLTVERQMKKMVLVVVGSDEGMNGAYNTNVLRFVREAVGKIPAGVMLEVIYTGKKLASQLRKLSNITLSEAPAEFHEKQYAEGVNLLAKQLTDRFQKAEIDRVDVVYTHYKSRGTQIVTQTQLLPLSKTALKEFSAKSEENDSQNFDKSNQDDKDDLLYYFYEPSGEEIVAKLYPLIVRTKFYKFVLESRTSEEAMRIIAMQTANDNADKLTEQLQLQYNKLRQQNITNELLDLVEGQTERD
ncbi:MAG: ATP synthase F1 subunit gamma [Culturomica sp.]|jgi:F-type H+-transporting ATPase subunit gamma|nr:ATP synthase F1 subunit gamma [Culturomica sp.]